MSQPDFENSSPPSDMEQLQRAFGLSTCTPTDRPLYPGAVVGSLESHDGFQSTAAPGQDRLRDGKGRRPVSHQADRLNSNAPRRSIESPAPVTTLDQTDWRV